MFIPFHIVPHATRRIQVYRLEWSHERPSQRQSFANSGIYVLHTGIAFRDQTKCFFQQRSLQPVHDEAVQFTLHDDG